MAKYTLSSLAFLTISILPILDLQCSPQVTSAAAKALFLVVSESDSMYSTSNINSTDTNGRYFQ